MSDSECCPKRPKLLGDCPTGGDNPDCLGLDAGIASASADLVWDIQPISTDPIELCDSSVRMSPPASTNPEALVGPLGNVGCLAPPLTGNFIVDDCLPLSLSPTLDASFFLTKSQESNSVPSLKLSASSCGSREPSVFVDTSHLLIRTVEEPESCVELHKIPLVAPAPVSADMDLAVDISHMNVMDTNAFKKSIADDLNQVVALSPALFASASETSETEQYERGNDGDDGASVTSELEYFYDACDYFTQETDPWQHTGQHENVSEDSDEILQPGDNCDSPTAGEFKESGSASSDPPLYSGAKVTVSEASIAFLTFMLSNDVSGELLTRFLAFIQLILPPDNKFFSTIHLFMKHFKHMKGSFKFIYYCSSCKRGVDKKDSVCVRCGPKGKIEYYLNLPLIPQIKSLYSNSTFLEALSYRFNRKKLVEDNVEDIYDGDVYKSASDILSQPFNISLFWNTDGISLFKSSGFQIWPFYFIVNELPPHLRYKEEYMLLAGLAFGYEKPACNVFLKPIWEETQVLKNGIDVSMPQSQVPFNIKCIVLCGSCDALAKSAFMRFTNFNGFHGCPRCLIKGQYHKEGKVFTYPFDENASLRTEEGYKSDLDRVKESGGKTYFNGVQGPTYLYSIVWSFFLSSTAIDVMHNVYLGVCRQLFFLWFSKTFIKRVFGDNSEKKALLALFSEILCKMEAPHYMSRPPRSLLNVKYFKASELRTWLFSTALPLLEKHMKEQFLDNFKKFVCALALLNQDSISRQDIRQARSLLKSFVIEFQELYGLRNMSFNIHCVLHLCDATLALGPLWASSCFGFEDLNGRLARLVHGTRHAGLQIYSHLGLVRNLHSLTNSLMNVTVKEFCQNMILKFKHLKIVTKVENGILIVGKLVNEHTLPPCYNKALCDSTSVSANYSFFFRLKKCKYLFVSEDYGRGNRDSSCVQYTWNNTVMYGCVKVFVKVSDCHCQDYCQHSVSYFALINRFNYSVHFQAIAGNDIVSLGSLLLCQASDDIDCVPISSLLCVCFRVQVESHMFLSVPLNSQELE